MGASGWSHFGPYNGDLAAAFRILCQQVFVRGDYHKIWLPPEEDCIRAVQWVDQMIAFSGLESVLARYQHNAIGSVPRSRSDLIEMFVCTEPEPATIEELLAFNETNGTHSILDYAHSGYDYNVLPAEVVVQRLHPISDKALLHVFGTTQPTHEMVVTNEPVLWQYILNETDDVEGDYMLVYENGKVVEWFVMGISGD